MNTDDGKTYSEMKYKDLCCCCHKGDCSKDISTEYYFSGQQEIYEVMLNDTFGIQIRCCTNASTTVKEFTRGICEDCIMQLRQASNFKQMVLSCEKRFDEYLDSFSIKEEITSDDEVCVKDELIFIDEHLEDQDERDSNSVNTNVQFEEQDERDSNSVNIDDQDERDNDIVENDSADDEEILQKLKTDKKSVQRKPQRRKSKTKMECDNKGNQSSDSQKDWTKILERRGSGPLLRKNSLKLLANSNICLFQWNKSRYRCFCCKEPFEDMDSLREHNSYNHSLEDIEKMIIKQQNKLLKAEISSVQCKLCTKNLKDLNELHDHLTGEHCIELVTKEHLLVPFKITEQLQCQICSETFSGFRLLNIHMNKHFQKQICHICGTSWSNLVLLNLHKIRSHRPLTCKQCDITFTSKSDKKSHDVDVHNVKFERKLRFPCPYCPERFFQENRRVLHLVEKHGMTKPQHKCLICTKVFVTKSLCNGHMKNVHKKEKNQECDVCHKVFYTKSDVLRHKVTHTGEKKHFCNICSTPFATKDSLRRHLKRTHMGMH